MLGAVVVLVSEVKIPPLPLVALLPVHEKVAVGSHEVKVILTGSPEQTASGLGVAVISGAGSIVIVLLGKPVTVFPQASVIVGLRTAIEPERVQYCGHPGMVS